MNSPDPLRGKVAAQLTAMSMPGGPLHTKSDASTMIRFAASPAWLRFRRTVIDWCLARETPLREGRVAILMAGPPGASKSTAQAHMVGEHLQGWRHMDADEFELRLLAAADADGLLQQFLPEELRSASGQPSRFYPNDLSALVHIESNFLLETVVTQSLREYVIIDGTRAWKPWVPELVTRLGREQYTIGVADVETSRCRRGARCSSDGHADVDNYRLSSDVTARLGCKPHHRTRQLFWFAGSSEEHAPVQLFDVALWVFPADGTREDAWSNCIDANAFSAAPLLCEVAGDAGDGSLARAVGSLRQARVRDSQNARDVHYRAPRLHHSPACLCRPVRTV